MTKDKTERNIPRTLLAVIEGSVGTNMFRQFFISHNEIERDVMRDGDVSCAFYVSGVLHMFDLVSGVHGTVGATEHDMLKNGWRSVSDFQKGDVLIWESETFESGESHRHIGFYIGNELAISNTSLERTPQKHNYHKVCFTDPTKNRAIESILRHSLFDQVSDL